MIYPPEYIGETPSTKQAAAEAQFAEMRDVIEPARVLDIGCGFGFIDVLIAKHAPVSEIHLLDGVGDAPQDGGYKHTMRAWSDVRVAEAIVRANVPEAAVYSYPVDAHSDLLLLEHDIDLVISCRSWGHHFPISTYLPLTRVLIRPGGHVITDIRNGTDGVEQLRRAGFKQIARIPDPSTKCERWLFEATAV